jgi:hypothetical protein
VLALALLAAVAAAAPLPAPAATVSLPGPVPMLAADGGRVAFATSRRVGAFEAEFRIGVWKPPAARVSVLLRARHVSDAYDVEELALAGTRVAWIDVGHGNGEQQDLWTASVSGPVRAVGGEYYNSVGGLRGGTYVGGLAGAGDLLVVNTWEQCDELDVQSGKRDPSCVPSDPSWISSVRLAEIGPSVLRPLLAGPDAMLVAAVDDGRVLLRRGRSVTVVDRSGARVATHELPARTLGVALDRAAVVVLTSTRVGAGDTGCALGSPPTKRRLADAAGGLAAVLDGARRLRLVRLRDCRELRLDLDRGTFGDAALTEAGLWYSVAASRAAGTVAFVPAARLRAAFR